MPRKIQEKKELKKELERWSPVPATLGTWSPVPVTLEIWVAGFPTKGPFSVPFSVSSRLAPVIFPESDFLGMKSVDLR